MASRPTFIDVRSQSHGPLGGGSPSMRPLTSPRLHVAGEIPPELSPLDAFAAQSRLLAKQLEKSSTNGKRISRLPPLTIKDSLNLPRPGYFHSASAENLAGNENQQSNVSGSGLKTELEDPSVRPISIYPRFSHIPNSHPNTNFPGIQTQDEDQPRGRRAHVPLPDFGVRREQSPSSIDRAMDKARLEASPSYFAGRPSIDSMSQRGHQLQRTRDTSAASHGYDTRALAPPRSPFTQKTPSIQSVSADSSDDDCSSSIGAPLSEFRKFSSGSGLSNSPMSPFAQSIPRSPSVSSDLSNGGSRLSRPTFNFSRPLSRASELPLEMPSRQTSSDSQPFVLTDDTVHTPVSMNSEGFPESNNISPGAPSYVYSRFSLPRGKMLQRNSRIFRDNQPPMEFHWEQPIIPHSNVEPYNLSSMATPPSPLSRPSTSSLGQVSSTSVPESSNTAPTGGPDEPNKPRQSYDVLEGHNGRQASTSGTRPYTTTSVGSGSTIKASTQKSHVSTADISSDEHVAKGIACHESGSLNESTYHLRIAARQNHPTGMLLYALACRHGWGMRANQREGVQWLRKAADCAFLEVADDEDLLKEGRSVDILEQRTRKAQFALSIYELGVSHMNGWGIEQDKVLALRCFEIAGAWGDADALAEAGFCYAQGIGCKKDLKKSAKFYRMAESKGISMVGNSWIYKSKYKDKNDQKEVIGSPEKKSRNKSRTRTMFGRMKPNS